MNKIGLGVLNILAITALVSCEPSDTGTTGTKYPTADLSVDKQQNVLVIETTGAWCQYCPNGAEMLTAAEVTYEGRLVTFAAHTGDELEGDPATLINTNFPTSGVPNFYVMNEDAGQSVDGPISAALYPDPLPFFGVKHVIRETDTSYNVYPLVEVFGNTTGEDYLIQTYMLLDAVLAKDYGTMDLNQVSSVPIVQTGSGTTPSKWALDAAVVNGEAQIKAGDLYYHEHVLWSMDERNSDWGYPLAAFNPFGNDYIEGDLLGTKYTPILLSVEKENLTPWETSISFATVVWKLRTDGTGGYDYVNGYVSHFSH